MNTLFIIKPDAVERRLMGTILRQVEELSHRIQTMDFIRLLSKEVDELYAAHTEKPYYKRHKEHMMSGESLVIVTSVCDYTTMRILALNIRKKHGVINPKNLVHSSDSLEAAAAEITWAQALTRC